MTEEEAEEIMMLVEDYGKAKYSQANSEQGWVEDMTEAARKAELAWCRVWENLKLHVSKDQ